MFYSSFTGKKIVAKNMIMFLMFEMETMKYYHDLYFKSDVLLLADVFEKFRNNSLRNYGICPSHY